LYGRTNIRCAKPTNIWQDPAEREKITALLKEHKAASHELAQKERALKMKKLELALKTESDPAKAELLKAKLEDMKKKSLEPHEARLGPAARGVGPPPPSRNQLLLPARRPAPALQEIVHDSKYLIGRRGP
jgi:hypothetical protein